MGDNKGQQHNRILGHKCKVQTVTTVTCNMEPQIFTEVSPLNESES